MYQSLCMRKVTPRGFSMLPCVAPVKIGKLILNLFFYSPVIVFYHTNMFPYQAIVKTHTIKLLLLDSVLVCSFGWPGIHL